MQKHDPDLLFYPQAMLNAFLFFPNIEIKQVYVASLILLLLHLPFGISKVFNV